MLALIHPSDPWPLPGHPEAMKMSCRRDYFHTSAEKGYSRKFGVASDPPRWAPGTRERPAGTVPRSKRPDQVAFVAPSCSKVLRLATTRLPEKSTPIGPGKSRTSP